MLRRKVLKTRPSFNVGDLFVARETFSSCVGQKPTCAAEGKMGEKAAIERARREGTSLTLSSARGRAFKMERGHKNTTLLAAGRRGEGSKFLNGERAGIRAWRQRTSAAKKREKYPRAVLRKRSEAERH